MRVTQRPSRSRKARRRCPTVVWREDHPGAKEEFPLLDSIRVIELQQRTVTRPVGVSGLILAPSSRKCSAQRSRRGLKSAYDGPGFRVDRGQIASLESVAEGTSVLQLKLTLVDPPRS